MKIAIIGTHCSGKTTLIDMLYGIPELHEYSFFEEPVREVSRSRFKINKESDEAAQLAMLACHLRNLAFDNFVSDRSILDLYVYCTTLPKVTQSTKDFIFKKVIDNIDRYDYLFWCAPEFSMAGDGFRETDDAWQKQIESSFKVAYDYLKTHDTLKHCKIIRLTGETPQRFEQVKQLIGSKNLNKSGETNDKKQ